MKKTKNNSVYSGINIQFPISKLILNGIKSIETRTYPIPKKYLGINMVMLETPGKTGRFKTRAVAIIRFDACFKYNSKSEFYKDTPLHHVGPDSEWAWIDGKNKWGWKLVLVEKFNSPIQIKQRIGIRYTVNIKLN